MPKAFSIVLSLIVAFWPTTGSAFLDFLFKKKSEESSMLGSKELPDVPAIHVNGFTGGTGESVTRFVREEVLASNEFLLASQVDQAAFRLEGSSVGGRVVGKLLDAEGKTLFSRTYAAPGIRENVLALVDDVIFAATGKPGLALSRIVFVSDVDGTKQVYLCGPNGGEVQKVTSQKHGAVSPSLSPDVSMVAYTTYRSGYPVVEVMDLHSGWKRTVTDTPGSSFGASFAPDEPRLAVVMSFLGNPEVFVTDLNSNTAGCLSDTVGVPSSPVWHPDGKQIMFSCDEGGGSELFVVELPEGEDGSSKLFRWRSGQRFSTDPSWSPSGDKVAFTAVSSRGSSSVIVKPYPEGRSKVVASGGAQHPSWSPNGRFLVYAKRGDLVVYDLRSHQSKTILTDYGTISEPRWMK